MHNHLPTAQVRHDEVHCPASELDQSSEEFVKDAIDPMEFRTADISSFRTRFGVMDVLMELSGVGPFDAVRRNARRYQWETITITVASIDDIITSKETADRAKTAARSMRSTRRGTIFVSTPTRTNYRRAPWIPSRRTTNSDELPWR